MPLLIAYNKPLDVPTALLDTHNEQPYFCGAYGGCNGQCGHSRRTLPYTAALLSLCLPFRPPLCLPLPGPLSTHPCPAVAACSPNGIRHSLLTARVCAPPPALSTAAVVSLCALPFTSSARGARPSSALESSSRHSSRRKR